MPAARPSRSPDPAPPRPRPAPASPTSPRSGASWLKRLVATTLLLAGLGLGAGALGFAWLDATLPDVFSFAAYRQIAREASRVHAAGGEVVARFGEEVRTVVPAERIPDTVRYALVCAEDAAFYHHPGLDVVGIARALWIDLTRGRMAQGASTITQQFAKTRFLGREKTLTRKLKELVLARKLERRLAKDEILTLYANEVYFGHGRYGVEEAARFYFGKSIGEVDVAEAALLAGVVNSPGRLSPLRHPDRARARRSYVLQQMHEKGYLAAEDLARAEARPLPTRGHDDRTAVGGWYVEEVRRFVLQKVDAAQLAEGGLRVEVALDATMQRAAEAAVRAGLERLDVHYGTAEPVRRYADDAELAAGLRRLAGQQKPVAGKLPWGKVLLGAVVGTDAEAKGWRVDLGGVVGVLPFAAVQRYHLPPKLPKAPKPPKGAPPPPPAERKAPEYARGDLLRVSVRDQGPKGTVLVPEFGPQVALVAIEPQTRLVRALVGGDDFAWHPYNRATQARRQPGSTFKTFAYGAALEAGLVTPDTERVDEARTWHVGGRAWTPRNYSGRYDGQSHSLRDALAHSINSIAVAVASEVGPERIAAFAERMGIESPLVAGLPLALGASSVSPLELTNAYATLAAGGREKAAVLVTRIVDRDGKDLYLAPRDEGVQVLGEATARALIDMLGEVVRRGSGKDAKVGRPVAGKTGTSNGSRDAWFVGFSADLCAGVWVGYDDRKPLAKGSGGTLAVPIWADFMRQGLEQFPVRPLPRLPHVLAGPVGNLPEEDPEAGAADLDDTELEPALDEPEPAQPPPPLPVTTADEDGPA